MRFSSSVFIATAFLMLSSATLASAESSTQSLLTANLSLGSRNAQVIVLQQMLNRDLDTRIASTGPGSLGNETNYFGVLTKSAVIRFQEKYANEVLTPAGLIQGSGYAGSYTRTKLNSISAVVSAGNANTSVQPPAGIPPVSIPTLVVTTPALPPVPTSTTQNSHMENLNLYIAAVEKGALKGGLSQSKLPLLEEKIRKEDATVDFNKQFFDKQRALYEKKISEDTSKSPVLALFEKAIYFITKTFSTEKAYAGIGLPFGGYITYVNPLICDCPPGITQIFVALPDANPLMSNLLLNYVDGTEAFSWYNIPEDGIAVLGFYEPAIPSCWTYVGEGCSLIEDDGQITPIVGSSLSPG